MKKLLALITIFATLVQPVYAERLGTIGFEDRSVTAGEEFSSSGLTADSRIYSIDSSVGTRIAGEPPVPHGGVAALQLYPGTAAFNWIGHIFRANGSASSTARCYVYILRMPASNDVDLCAFWDSAGANRRAGVELGSTSVAQLLQDNNTRIGSVSATLQTGRWYRIEITAEGTNAGTEDLIGYIDGVSFASTAVATVGNFDAVYIGSPNATASFDVTFDDIAVNDGSGSFQNFQPGDGVVFNVFPNAGGDNTPDGCNNTNPCGTPSNSYQNVDDIDPDGASTFVDLDNATSIADWRVGSSSVQVATTSKIYYADASVSGPTDSGSAWTNDANGYDSSTSTVATTLIPGSGNALVAAGTNAPATGNTILNVQMQIVGTYTGVSFGEVDVYSGADLVCSNTLGADGYSIFQACIAPTGGWTWAKVQGLTSNAFLDTAGTFGLGQVQFIVTSSVESYDAIQLATAHCNLREEASLATLYQLRLHTGAGSTKIATTSSQDVGNTAFRTDPLGTTQFRVYDSTSTSPATGIAWTLSELDSMQVGVGSLSANDIDITACWVTVEIRRGTAPVAVTKPLLDDGQWWFLFQ